MDSKRISERFWKLIISIRNTGIDYQVLLIILILYKKSVLKEFINSGSENFIDTVYKSINEFSELEKELLLDLVRHFEKDLQKFNSKYLYELNHILDEHKEDFYIIFDELLFKLEEIMGKSSGGNIQPDEITKLMLFLADIENGNSVFNPFSGLASFGVNLNSQVSYFAQEIVERTYIYSQLRLLAYDKLSQVEVKCEDTILKWPEDSKFDRIISSPPFNVDIGNIYSDSDSKTLEHFYLSKAINSISGSGKIITLVSNGLLFRSGQLKDFRKYLVDNDLIESIISLPGNLLSSTSISTSIIVISKQKEKKGFIKFIDASTLFTESSRRAFLLTDKIVSIYQLDNDSEHTRLVSISEIAFNDYDLSVSRYFIGNITKKFQGIELDEILKKANVEKVKSDVNVPYLKIGDLNDNEMGVYSDAFKIERREVKRSGYRLFEPVLLLAT
ncbi:unnamed protein product, partial [Chrysoparadoxa australica]